MIIHPNSLLVINYKKTFYSINVLILFFNISIDRGRRVKKLHVLRLYLNLCNQY
jgi:hypothetical protein